MRSMKKSKKNSRSIDNNEYFFFNSKKSSSQCYDQLEKIVQKYEGEIRNHIRVKSFSLIRKWIIVMVGRAAIKIIFGIITREIRFIREKPKWYNNDI